MITIPSFRETIMNKLRSFIIPFIVFIITFVGFVVILERGAEDGKYEKEVFVNSPSKVLKLEAIENDIAAVQLDNRVLLMKEGDSHVIKDTAADYTGSVKILKVKDDSIVASFDVQKANGYYTLIFLAFMFSLIVMLFVCDSAKKRKRK